MDDNNRAAIWTELPKALLVNNSPLEVKITGKVLIIYEIQAGGLCIVLNLIMYHTTRQEY